MAIKRFGQGFCVSKGHIPVYNILKNVSILLKSSLLLRSLDADKSFIWLWNS